MNTENTKPLPVRLNLLHVKRLNSRIYRTLAKCLLDTQQLIILRHTLTSARRTRLNLAGIQRNRCLLYTSDAADEEDSVDLGGGL